ncbi:DNA-3-methyladenine glycosylase I [Mycoplasmatota bacterium]|nr:DNA-3-methyladenine glycosylase I [Mycoplasmatota bacterium]
MRCDWCLGDELYIKYHDEEWGRPVYDDQTLFEFLVLESMQAGLSWITILRKRENFRKAFDYFNVLKVSQYDEAKILELLNNPGIIRYRRKIEAAINNAKMFIEIQKEFGSFSTYLWRFVNHKQIINHYQQIDDIPTTSKLSDLIASDLKKRGFKFLGSTIIYSYLEAVGVIDDHIETCIMKNRRKIKLNENKE